MQAINGALTTEEAICCQKCDSRGIATKIQELGVCRIKQQTCGQMFTQIFTPMKWYNSSGSCTRGAATCTTWLLGWYAARTTQSEKKVQFSKGSSDALKTARGSFRELLGGQLQAYCSHSTAQTELIQPTLPNHQEYVIAMFGTVSIN